MPGETQKRLNYLADLGLKPRIKRNKRHYVCEITVDGKTGIVVWESSASDVRAFKNFKRNVRRAMRQIRERKK